MTSDDGLYQWIRDALAYDMARSMFTPMSLIDGRPWVSAHDEMHPPYLWGNGYPGECGHDDCLLICSAVGCDKPAVYTVFIRDHVGHVHDCSRHTMELVEWCDVVKQIEIVANHCPAQQCERHQWFKISKPRTMDEGTPVVHPPEGLTEL